MRVIAGSLGGRIFASPNGHRTHPMSDKMRGALFNILGDIEGLSVLDAFAGSGALSFEAVSRGAATVVAIERDRRAQETIIENVENLDISDRIQVVRGNAKSWLRNHREQFDVILLDPPYNVPQEDLLEAIAKILKPTGTIILSWPPNRRLPLFEQKLVASKSYGDGNLHIYEATSR
jgi:16S rRNA (guanine966-N2)-methyltransferase